MTDRASRSTSSNLANLLREFELTKDLLVRIVTPDDPERDERGDADGDGDGDGDPGERRLYEALTGLRKAMLLHPAAARAIVAFLVAEGRHYAETPDGALRYQSMIGSPEVERLRTIWEKVTLNLLDDQDDESDVPEAWVELIRDLAVGSGLDRVAEQLRPEGLT